MPEFTDNDSRALRKAHSRLDSMSEVVIQLKAQNEYQEKHAHALERVMHEHMKKEEIMWTKMQLNFDALTRYKWIALGIIGTLLVLTSDNETIAKLLSLLSGT